MIAYFQLLEIRTPGQHLQHITLSHRFPYHGVEDLHGLTCYVIVAGRPAEVWAERCWTKQKHVNSPENITSAI